MAKKKKVGGSLFPFRGQSELGVFGDPRTISPRAKRVKKFEEAQKAKKKKSKKKKGR